ncbi:MAG: putative DNA-binding domain-containing protein [Vitreoscilla sp.]|nr:putative DNA-binding domain-containing protein [Vitreoscilla sp.]MBP6675210.1 putative DNA-binding domain-containing protein [Vitreoscilla sp.]
MSAVDSNAEALRQQALIDAVAGAQPIVVAGLRPLPGPSGQAPADAGLRAYRHNAMATAWRALAAAYPTLQQLLGDEAMKALARDLWHSHPPVRGDLAWFGAELPPHLATLADYAGMPWLADLARLDWAVHRAGFAGDAKPGVEDLALLGEHDPQCLGMVWAPGCTWLSSAWPVEALWRAHQSSTDEVEQARLWAAANEALCLGRKDCVWVQRRGWEVVLAREDDAAAAAFNTHLWRGATLGEALETVLAAAQADFSFEDWLVQTLQAGRLAAVRLIPAA